MIQPWAITALFSPNRLRLAIHDRAAVRRLITGHASAEDVSTFRDLVRLEYGAILQLDRLQQLALAEVERAVKAIAIPVGPASIIGPTIRPEEIP